MKRKNPSALAVTLSVRPFIGRAVVGLLFTACLGLIFISKSPAGIAKNIRMEITDTLVPVVAVLAKPVDAFESVVRWGGEMATLRAENVRLKSDNLKLAQWQAVATELESENGKLRNLLKFAPTGKSAYTSARIAVASGNGYGHSAVITAGSELGVEPDLAVINDSGLVGRVIDVGKKTARVLLLTDMNSRVPVISETSRERSIAGGNGGDALNLLYMPENSKLTVGEKIITSGDGGVLPPGLPVGVVTKIDKNVATVRPLVDWYHLEYVSVVDFSM